MDDAKNLIQERETEQMSSGPGTGKKKRKSGSRERKHKLLYASAYLDLSPNILSDAGKKIVEKDPNLSEDTLKKLLALQGGCLCDVPFHFGLQGWGENNDAGCALLSSCIKDNFQSTWAELVGRYADMRRRPFLEIAIGLKQYDHEYGLAYYNEDHELVPWKPYIVDMDSGELTQEEQAEQPFTLDEGITGMEGLVTDFDAYANRELQKKFWR